MKNKQQINDSVNYYDNFALAYYQSTVDSDMSEQYRLFESYLPHNGTILDGGCGSGRDSLYFLKQGYKVRAFDASRRMVHLSSKLTGLAVEWTTFEAFESDEEFDGIWTCASLLHLDENQISKAVAKLISHLKDQGIMYMSFKEGAGAFHKDGRLFTCYNEETLPQLLESITNIRLLRIYRSADVREGRSGEYWINAIIQKENMHKAENQITI